MNNQSNLIDAEKIFRWAELCVIPVRAEDIRRAHALGLFAPDSAPTIKPGDKVVSTRNPGLGQGTVILDPRLKQEPGMEWVLYKDVLLHESISVLEVVEWND